MISVKDDSSLVTASDRADQEMLGKNLKAFPWLPLLSCCMACWLTTAFYVPCSIVSLVLTTIGRYFGHVGKKTKSQIEYQHNSHRINTSNSGDAYFQFITGIEQSTIISSDRAIFPWYFLYLILSLILMISTPTTVTA